MSELEQAFEPVADGVEVVTGLTSVADEEGEAPELMDEIPDRLSPDWTGYVLSHMEDDEKDGEGRPRVTGLRRVTELLVGEITHSEPVDIWEANIANGFRSTVAYRVSLTTKDGTYKSFGGVADCYLGNCSNPDIAKHAAAVAETRAEARALKKLLGLNVLTAEEATFVSFGDDPTHIVSEQIQFIDELCKRCDIKAWNFLNRVEPGTTFKRLDEVPYHVAVKAADQLSGYQNDLKSIPKALKGYNSEWLTKAK